RPVWAVDDFRVWSNASSDDGRARSPRTSGRSPRGDSAGRDCDPHGGRTAIRPAIGFRADETAPPRSGIRENSDQRDCGQPNSHHPGYHLKADKHMSQILPLIAPAPGSTAKVAPQFGFNCFSYRPQLDGEPVELLWSLPEFATTGAKPTASGIPILFPFAG